MNKSQKDRLHKALYANYPLLLQYCLLAERLPPLCIPPLAIIVLSKLGEYFPTTRIHLRKKWIQDPSQKIFTKESTQKKTFTSNTKPYPQWGMALPILLVNTKGNRIIKIAIKWNEEVGYLPVSSTSGCGTTWNTLDWLG